VAKLENVVQGSGEMVKARGREVRNAVRVMISIWYDLSCARHASENLSKD
jgi:hypothetical protein